MVEGVGRYLDELRTTTTPNRRTSEENWPPEKNGEFSEATAIEAFDEMKTSLLSSKRPT